jgi:crossover junction endodeoxyribonuclease RuvC
MRILGLDPGLTTIGIGLIEAGPGDAMEAVEWLTIKTQASDTSLSDRLAEIAEDFDAILDEMQPELAVVEQIFFARNERTAIGVAHARGVLLAALARRGIPILEPTPMQMKSAISGDGHADKRQVGSMLTRWLKMETSVTSADASDALALAVYGALMRKSLAVIR